MQDQLDTPAETANVPGEPSAARRVAINAVSPFAAQLITKVLMLGYGVVQFRLVDSASLGWYILAALLFSYTSSIAEWGLGTLMSRDVARERGTHTGQQLTNALFSDTLSLRLLLSLVLFLPVGLFTAIYLAFFGLSTAGALSIGILTLSLLPSAFSGTVTALLYGHERMSLPAVIGVATAALNVTLGIGALLLGWGVAGLAFAALLTTLVTSLVFASLLRRDFPDLRARLSMEAFRLSRTIALPLLKAGWPLMLNALLVGLFFRVDTFIIGSLSPAAVARYDAAYRFLNFVLLITPAVTLALFPRMSRHAANDRPRLLYEYTFALRVLSVAAVPLVSLTVWFSPLLVSVLTGGKSGYLPESATALQILIFFLPFSFVNGLTQYVLIALDKQRLITRAFGFTVLFNVGANLLLVPLLGINGAALTTVGSEIVLLCPFVLWVSRELGVRPGQLLSTAAKPFAAGAGLALAIWLLWPLMWGWSTGLAALALYAAVGAGLFALYGACLYLLKPFNTAEMVTLKRAIHKN
ncbi:MAG: flippase [Chloroflexota bacterium]|nr:flippase [Chloroflexota bacterium]